MKESEEKIAQSASFAVHIHYFQNATWQGEIVWMNENRSQYFRSELELLALIEQALDSQMPEESNMKKTLE